MANDKVARELDRRVSVLLREGLFHGTYREDFVGRWRDRLMRVSGAERDKLALEALDECESDRERRGIIWALEGSMLYER